ncbi:hypothetical protein RHMOL_Rhmol09G0026600 [Rhododendron molle]|uniref:Uncharacterized protein n=1 Tax=Rhododendron molle TaxID=49168 RepID=A0ACC0M9E9_RHOML|nr:hypothetical protein RHMOL_Rhmol09G0026600 [Rhododendron molle]
MVIFTCLNCLRYITRATSVGSGSDLDDGRLRRFGSDRPDYCDDILNCLTRDERIWTNCSAKPCKSLWVSGISPAVTKEILQEEFLKFGKIEELKFNRDRKTAYVDYFRLEYSSEALKRMNGKRIGSDQIRVDYFRSRTSKRENSANNRDPREGQFLSRTMVLDSPRMPQDVGRNYSELSKRQQCLGQLLGENRP